MAERALASPLLAQPQTGSGVVPVVDDALRSHHLDAAPLHLVVTAVALNAIGKTDIPPDPTKAGLGLIVGFLVVAEGIALDPPGDELDLRLIGEFARQIQTMAAALSVGLVQVDPSGVNSSLP